MNTSEPVFSCLEKCIQYSDLPKQEKEKLQERFKVITGDKSRYINEDNLTLRLIQLGQYSGNHCYECRKFNYFRCTHNLKYNNKELRLINNLFRAYSQHLDMRDEMEALPDFLNEVKVAPDFQLKDVYCLHDHCDRADALSLREHVEASPLGELTKKWLIHRLYHIRAKEYFSGRGYDLYPLIRNLAYIEEGLGLKLACVLLFALKEYFDALIIKDLLFTLKVQCERFGLTALAENLNNALMNPNERTQVNALFHNPSEPKIDDHEDNILDELQCLSVNNSTPSDIENFNNIPDYLNTVRVILPEKTLCLSSYNLWDTILSFKKYCSLNDFIGRIRYEDRELTNAEKEQIRLQLLSITKIENFNDQKIAFKKFVVQIATRYSPYNVYFAMALIYSHHHLYEFETPFLLDLIEKFKERGAYMHANLLLTAISDLTKDQKKRACTVVFANGEITNLNDAAFRSKYGEIRSAATCENLKLENFDNYLEGVKFNLPNDLSERFDLKTALIFHSNTLEHLISCIYLSFRQKTLLKSELERIRQITDPKERAQDFGALLLNPDIFEDENSPKKRQQRAPETLISITNSRAGKTLDPSYDPTHINNAIAYITTVLYYVHRDLYGLSEDLRLALIEKFEKKKAEKVASLLKTAARGKQTD